LKLNAKVHGDVTLSLLDFGSAVGSDN